MLRMSTLAGLSLASLLIFATDVRAGVIVIDFETLADGDIVTTQFPGLTFTNAVALQAGISLNELEFPPASGVMVVSDLAGPITIDFATPPNRLAAGSRT